MGWIGVDFDGVLAVREPGQGSRPGKPVQLMVERVKGWLRDGYDVRVFTARANDAQQVVLVKKWLKDNGLGDLVVTCNKDEGLIELWDDRAVRVVRNTGAPCSSCVGYSWLSRWDIKTDC
ncbi:TPA: hypothetical protein J1413_001361 [Escherichia coli]|nr:hypothetical protein [Escherichia coli]HBA9519630.1 hypothetical protein [Escherichia coli]HBA9548869.1 hypothetical protein [Escherichia coli]HBA9557008.1 hypothetical protein [Escherichia coli]